MGLSDVFIAMQYVSFIFLGFVAPFVACLGYLWVDTFYPQSMSTLLSSVPVALIMGSVALFTYIFLDRRSPPRINLTMVLTLAMAVWTTLTTTWAVAPAEAWLKWDWATKTIAFSAFIPFFIRSRVQIEAFIQVFLFSLALNIFPVGIKGLISGGGYQQSLAILDMRSGLTEGSTLATAAIMFVPLILHLRRHSLIISNPTFRSILYAGSVLICFAATIATSARTGLVGIVVLGIFLWLQSRRKVLGAAIVAVAAVTLVVASPEAWKDRMSTIEVSGQEGSAQGRLLIWQWTWSFVKANPAGGGFRADTTSRIVSGDVNFGSKAFHSIYFEVLGEQGFVGLAIFLAIIVRTVISLRGVVRRTRDSPDLVWCNDLARAMLAAFVVLLACGAFIGIAYQCMLWYVFALTTSLSEYVRRVQGPAKARIWHRDESLRPASGSRRLPST
jgi:putative inorganic carbon (hco3(-)) transporter